MSKHTHLSAVKVSAAPEATAVFEADPGAGTVKIGNQTGIKGLTVGTVSVDPPNQAAAGFFTVAVTVSGAAVGDVIVMHPPNTLESALRLVGYEITAANTVTIKMEATGAVDGAALNWGYVLFDLT
ncbi:MAG: hypothetical protein QN162_14605 [Armatimonadota bacterium]|nr:hypothetical protein [Armatimonadota bacterium]